MLLPSDVARLVLGYLQQEGLYNSSRTFIHESPNLKEYAEHSTEDGAIPACVFSLLGKNLTTILNEYVAAKTKETNQEIPLVMTSLWKKLDLTISQIKSMQNSLRPVGLQMRTPNGMTTMRQRALTHSPVVLSTPLGGPTTISPSSLTAHRMPVNSTPINYTFQPYRTTPIPMMQTPVPDPEPRVQTDLVNRDFPVQILVPDNRFATPSPMSPGRRKWDSPRRRGGALSGGSVLGRVNVSAGTLGTEPQTEDSSAGNENFPQLVIQNAREKILGDRSLQEKLAENINKILSSDTSPHTSKASCSAMDPDPSIDEILGLQGEIHMSNDAIQDILEQTESDPAFQALFDLFECGKTKLSGDPNQGDESVSSSPVESDKPELASDNIHAVVGDEGLVCEDPTTAHDVPTQMPGKSRSGLEHKTKKPRKSAPSSSSKTIPTSCGTRGLRREASQTTWSVGDEKQAAAPGRGDTDAVLSDDGAAMEIDEPSDSPPCPPAPHRTAPQRISKSPEVDGRSPQPASQTSNVTVTLASTDSSVMDPTPGNSVLSATGSDCNVNRVEGEKPALCTGHTNVQTKNTQVECEPNIISALPPSALGSPSSVAIVKPVTDRSKKTATANVSAPQGKTSIVPPEERDSHPLTSSTTSGLAGIAPNTNNSTAKTTTGGPATAFVPLSSSLFKNAAEDPNKIMTLNIIISDDQEEASSRSNTALNHAVSSISSDNIPTIFLSSPAKLPVKDTGSPFICIGQDETAQAVSGLQQSTEAPRAAANDVDPLSRGKAGTVAMPAPLVRVTAPAVVQRNNLQLTQGHPADLAQPSYILQLPLDSTNRTITGATTSYFLVTDPSSREGQGRQVLVSTGVQGQAGPLTSTTPYVAATPPCSQGYPTGSAVFFTSPSKPLMQNVVLPVPIVGQNQPERFQLLSNQFVAMPSPGPAQQSEPVKSTPTQVASKDTAISIFHKTAPPAPKVTQAHMDNSIPQIVPSTAATKLVQPHAASHEKNTSEHVLMKDIQPELTENTVQSKVAAGTSPSHIRILCFDGSTKEDTGLITASTTTSKPSVSSTSASPLVQQAEKDSPRSVKTKPAILGGAKPKRRIETVRCIENTQTTPWAVSDTDKSSSPTQETETQNKNTLKKSSDQMSNNAIHCRVGVSSQHSDPQKRTESRRKSRSAVREDVEETKANNSEQSTSLSSDLRLRSGSRKEKEEMARRKTSEKNSAKVLEGRSEKKTTAEPPKITANKENEVERAGLKEKEQQPSTSMSAPREFSPPPTVVQKPPTAFQGTTSKPAPKTPPKPLPKTPPKSLPRSRSRTPSKAPSKTASKMSPRTPSKNPSKTSPLIKAAEMLHDIQPPVTPPKRPAVGCQELPLPRTPGSGTGRLHEDPLDLTRTPTRQRPGRDGEGTPRHLVPPATPELPTCSPASEAGSENSINMAAHTLMILSRAAISRTGTPLKDSLRQEGAKGAKSPLAHKSKKRKQLEPPANPPAKKESRKSGTSGSKKKEKKQSKLLDSFPDDLDVDKFLSSLHYDE